MLQTWTLAKRPAACHLASQGLISRLEVLVPVLERHSGVSWKKKIKEMKENSLQPVFVPCLLVQRCCQGTCYLSRCQLLEFSLPWHHSLVHVAATLQDSLVLFQQGPRTDSVSSFSSVPRPGQTSIAQCLNHESLLCMDIALSFQVMGSEQPRDYGGGYEIIYHNQRTKECHPGSDMKAFGEGETGV